LIFVAEVFPNLSNRLSAVNAGSADSQVGNAARPWLLLNFTHLDAPCFSLS
jgi:hypothetical protein